MTQRSTKMELAREFYDALLKLGAKPEALEPARRMAIGDRAEIAGTVYRLCSELGAQSDLLRIVGSYGDTLQDTEVLEQMRQWNAR